MAGELWTDYRIPDKRWAGSLSVGGPNETKQHFSQGLVTLCMFLKGSVQFLFVRLHTYTEHPQIRCINSKMEHNSVEPSENRVIIDYLSAITATGDNRNKKCQHSQLSLRGVKSAHWFNCKQVKRPRKSDRPMST